MAGNAIDKADALNRIPLLDTSIVKTYRQKQVSGSVHTALSKKGESTPMDAAAGVAILLREKAPECPLATFSDSCVELLPRRGFALRDAIVKSQAHASTYWKRALTHLSNQPDGNTLDRLIVITDEQSHDGMLLAWTSKAYVVNGAPYKRGFSYGNGRTHIDRWSERIPSITSPPWKWTLGSIQIHTRESFLGRLDSVETSVSSSSRVRILTRLRPRRAGAP